MRADASARWALRSLERLEISWRLLWIAGFDPKRTDGLCKTQDFCDSDFALKIVTFREPDSIAWRARPATLGDAHEQLNQNRRPSCRPGSSPRTRMAVASTMRVFRACPVPDVGSLGGLPRIEFSQSPEGPDSLAAGKNAGNFFDSAVF